MAKIGVLGGTFNPIHNGHVMMAQLAKRHLDLDFVIVVPAGNPYFKKDILPFDMRYEMAEAAMISTGEDCYLVSRVEEDETKPSYTCLTLEMLHEQYPDDDLYFLCGADVLKTIATWERPERIFELAVLTVFPRNTGDPNDKVEDLAEALKAQFPNLRYRIIYENIPDISSTEIHRKIAALEDTKDLVPVPVEEYIYLNGLYQEGKMDRIINSLLETDAYKFSMGQAIYHQFPAYKTTWTFKCRNKDVHFTPEMVKEIKRQIKMYCGLRFKEDELEYLNNIRWLKGSYIDFLRLWHPRFEDFNISADDECGLAIETTGTWLNTSMYEIPTLAIVNEVYFRMQYDYAELIKDYEKRLDEKIKWLKTGKYNIGSFSEFGLRRRLSGEAQEMAVRKMKDASYKASRFVGTSNVFLARKYGVTPVGTMAHEWVMCVGQGNHKHNPSYSNWYMMDYWVKEYGILNGTALTDAITTDCFLRDFQLTFATLFSGVRHDSADPYVWGDKMIAHYNKLGIDPKTKTLLFSDSLNFEKANAINEYFKDQVKVAFGIGTYISNDTFAPPLNIVMKTTACNGGDVAKISDDAGKGICKNPEYVKYLERSIKWRMEHEKARYDG